MVGNDLPRQSCQQACMQNVEFTQFTWEELLVTAPEGTDQHVWFQDGSNLNDTEVQPN